MNRSLETVGEGVKPARQTRIASVAGALVARFNEWRYGPRFTSEKLAQDVRVLEVARRALFVSDPTISAHLNKMASDFAQGIAARGDEGLLEMSVDVVEPAPQANPGRKKIFSSNR